MTTPSLTDRYVWAASRSVPEKQRTDFARELRERIGDATDALRESGSSPTDAERATLTELGDPAALAASWTDRPLQLIGPRYFLIWWRTLKLVLGIVVPIVTAAVLFAKTLAEAPIWEAIGDALSSGFSAATGIAFWMTLAFALVDRYGEKEPTEAWTPDDLPSPPEGTGAGRLGDLVASVIFLALFAGAIIWQQFASFYTDAAGNPIPFLNPDLWSFWIPWFLGIAALEIAFAVAIYLRGWTWPLAVVNVALNAAFAIPAIWLLRSGQLVSDAYLEASGWPWGDAGTVILTIVTAAIVVASAWDAIEGVVKAARSSRVGWMA
ncbi:MAG: hypothetical protein GX427_03115 [Actinomycetales bacterium]|nr:hypothetical protein [Actinomycetales bacterium]